MTTPSEDNLIFTMKVYKTSLGSISDIKSQLDAFAQITLLELTKQILIKKVLEESWMTRPGEGISP